MDEAFEIAREVIADATGNLDNIISEEDAKLQIIVRILVEVLGWSLSDLSAERKHDDGYSDLILADRSHRAFLVEAKRIGRIKLNNYSSRRQYYKLSGPALVDALEGVRQAASYCNSEGIQLAVLTDGVVWVIFLPYVAGSSYADKQAVVFPSFDSILGDFAEFYALLSKTESKKNTYKLIFDRLHENRLLVSGLLVAPFGSDEIQIEPKSAMAFDLENVFTRFFSQMAGDSDPDLLIECFVETKESQVADFSLQRITENVLGNISPKTTPIEQGLSDIVKSTVEGDVGQTVFIVGPSGAGKSTFLARFFKKTLGQETRSRCIVVNINSLDATGDESTAVEWMRETAITSLESQIYAAGHPVWNELLALYHSEYVKRSEGVDAPLYKRDRDAFREKFSAFIDERVQQDREGYLRRILADLIHNRKMLPVFVIDNTDEFTASFKEQIFQYFQSIRRSTEHCLLIFPVTDRSAWSFSKTEIFNIYKSRSFYLPTPSPREVFRKRVDYLKDKLRQTGEGKVQVNYFTDRGIRVNIADLDGFASAINDIFVDQDYAARRIGEIANYNMRKVLALAQRIITSAVLGIGDIIRSYVTTSPVTPTPAKFMSALLKGDYNFYRSDDGHGVLNLFQVDREIRQSPLLPLRILTFLLDSQRAANDDKQRYVAVRSIYSFFELMALSEPAIERCLTALFSAGLIESYDPSMTEYSQDHRFAITYSGECHLALGRNSPTYFEQMALTTHITDGDVALQIASAANSKNPLSERMESVRALFSDFLAREDQRFTVVPSTPEFSRQASLANEIVAHWAGVSKTDAAEEAALYGTIEENVVCKVDWFDHYKGFGFVHVASQRDGAFLHIRILEGAGLREVVAGDEVRCDISRNEQGLVVSSAYAVSTPKTRTYRGTIVYLKEEDAYGFVNIPEIGQDAFLRYSLIAREDRGNLKPGLIMEVELATDDRGRYQVKRVVGDFAAH